MRSATRITVASALASVLCSCETPTKAKPPIVHAEGSVTALLVTEGNPILETLVETAGFHKLTVVTPQLYESVEVAGFDLIVFDRFSPSAIPSSNALYFGGCPPIEGLAATPLSTPSRDVHRIAGLAKDSPVMASVNMDELFIQAPAILTLPEGSTVLAYTVRGPVIAEISLRQRRHIIVAFELFESNWPMQPSLVVFVSNACRHLSRPERA